MGKWGAMNEIEYHPTGAYRRVLPGCEAVGLVGEIVKWWNWGGVSLRFADGTIALCADGDCEPAQGPATKRDYYAD